MRAFLDTNVYISNLLAPAGSSPPTLVVRTALAGTYILLVSQSLLAELRSRVARKPYLAARIPMALAQELIDQLTRVAEFVPEIPEPHPSVGRDRGDDYVIAHALLGRADYLVSGDADLTSLGRVGAVEIVDPARFLAVLRGAGAG